MDDRGLLDLMITRLPHLKAGERVLLCGAFNREADLTAAVAATGAVERILNRELPKRWDIERIRLMAEGDARRAQVRGINWVSWRSPAYPPLLRESYDPPAVLFFRGSLPNPEAPLAAIVGTRRPSPQAAAQAFDIARDLGRQGIAVVSGLALGIDAMAHRGNLAGGAPTVAVLGSGADEVYPHTNRALAQRILESGGALLSEYPPGTGPQKWHFPARNRIISGLSRGVVIVEAPQSSGALITARLALEQNRDLWVAAAGLPNPGVFGTIYDRRGTAKLVEDGAAVIDSAAVILREWDWENPAAGSSISGEERCGAEGGGGNTGGFTEGRALAASMARILDIDEL